MGALVKLMPGQERVADDVSEAAESLYTIRMLLASSDLDGGAMKLAIAAVAERGGQHAERALRRMGAAASEYFPELCESAAGDALPAVWPG